MRASSFTPVSSARNWFILPWY